MDPIGAMQLNEEQRVFYDKWDLHVSTAYIGMIRCYWSPKDSKGQNVVFQTSLEGSLAYVGKGPDIFSPTFYKDHLEHQKKHRADLQNQFKSWLGILMSFMNDTLIEAILLQSNCPLLGGRTPEHVVEFMEGLKDIK